MKPAKRLFPLFVAAMLGLGTAASSIAVEESMVDRGPLSDYCHKIRTQIVSSCASRFSWDKETDVEVSIDSNGKIVDTKTGGSADQKKAEEIIKSLDGLYVPPPSIKTPVWLTIWTSHKADNIAVNARDVDFGPYMALLQKRIKRAWFPPKGLESERVTVRFSIFSSGKIGGLRIHTSSGKDDCDKAALAAVNNAYPFDKLPDGSPDTVDIQFTFDYNVFKKGEGAGKTAGGASSSKAGDGVKVSSQGSVRPEERKVDSSGGAAMCLRQGMKAMEDKNYALAIQFLESAVALEPDNQTAKKSLSIAYNAFGSEQLKSNPDMAMESFKKSKKWWPENPMTPDSLEQAKKLYGQSSGSSSQPDAAGDKSGAGK